MGQRAKSEVKKITPGIVKMLKNEIWIFRGSLVREARSQVPSLYRLGEVPESYLAKARTPEERDTLKRRYISKKAEKLIGGESLYLKFVSPGQDPKDATPFTHPAVEDLLLLLFFPVRGSKKKASTRLALADPDAFDPIPIPTLALVATVICHSIEEFDNGTRRSIEFQESEKSIFYHDILDDMNEFVKSSSQGHLLQEVLQRLTLAGRSRLGRRSGRRAPKIFVPCPSPIE